MRPQKAVVSPRGEKDSSKRHVAMNESKTSVSRSFLETFRGRFLCRANIYSIVCNERD